MTFLLGAARDFKRNEVSLVFSMNHYRLNSIIFIQGFIVSESTDKIKIQEYRIISWFTVTFVQLMIV